MLSALTDRLAASPYLSGMHFRLPTFCGEAPCIGPRCSESSASPTIENYIGRVTDRPSFARVSAIDDRLAAEHEARRCGGGWDMTHGAAPAAGRCHGKPAFSTLAQGCAAPSDYGSNNADFWHCGRASFECLPGTLKAVRAHLLNYLSDRTY